MHPLVSIIVPNYCHSMFLEQRINSILNQSFDDFEVIILDDNSPDGGASKEVIEQYRDNTHVSHIVYNEVNSGSTFRQWDKGISLAKGEYIWIAESDDFCELNQLEILVKAISLKPKCAFAYVLSQHVDISGKPISIQYKKSKDKYLGGREFIQRYMSFGNPVQNVGSALIRKSVLESIDKYYESFVGAGDVLFWIELAEKGSVYIVNQPLNYYRQHNNKVTPKKEFDGTNLRESKRCFDYMVSHKLLSPIRKKIALGSAYRIISTQNLQSEEIRLELLGLWGVENINPLYVILARLLGKLRIYNIYF